MSIIGYIRVSTDKQNVENQKFEILQYSNTHNLRVDSFIQITISSRKTSKDRRIDELMSQLNSGDTLIVSELSRLGRSTSEVIELVNELVKRNIRFVAIKQSIDIDNGHNPTSKVMITIFSLMAELERDMISMRTKEALASKKASGIKLGRPFGSTSKSILDGKEDEIVELMKKKVAVSAIARIMGASRTTTVNFIRTRRLKSRL